MELRQKIDADLKNAMKTQDDLRRRTLRMVLSAIKLNEVEKGNAIDEIGILSIVQKEIKSRREAIADATKANRNDLIQAAQDEIKFLESYLPQGINDEELRELAKKVITELNVSSPSEMGKAIKVLLSRLQGRATGDQVSRIVRELLTKQNGVA